MTTPPSLVAADAAWNAATLDERLVYARRAHAAAAAPGGTTLAAWVRVFSAGDWPALLRRLSWDDLDERVARLALAPTAPSDGPTPSWTAWIDRFAEASRLAASRRGSSEWRRAIDRVRPPLEPPFIEAWIPLLDVARAALAERGGRWAASLADEAMCAIEQHLVRQMAAVGELALLERFRAGSSGYDEWIADLLDDGWPAVFDTYPVLARHLAWLAECWADATAELMRRLADDRRAIEVAFGAPADLATGVVPGLSDRHSGGRSVAMIRFASGLRLAYKPRDMRLEAACNALLAWLRDAGLDDAPPPLRVLVRPGYGWMEWAEQGTFSHHDEVARYFRRAGGLVCLVHLLGGTDVHGENVVASCDGPRLVDAEMLLQPVTGAPPPAAAETTSEELGTLGRSCVMSGLVSLVHLDADRRPHDVGGLAQAAARAAIVPWRRWEALRTDGIRFALDPVVTPAQANDVRLNGATETPDRHRQEILAGFETTYRFLLGRRTTLLLPDSPLAAFEPCSTRVLFRQSNQYAALLRVLAGPRYQRRGVDRSLALESLARGFRHSLDRPLLWPLVADERRALEALDIPRLDVPASSRAIAASDGSVINGYVVLSGFEAVATRLLEFGAEDLEFQRDQLCAALARATFADRACRARTDLAAGSVAAEPDASPPVMVSAARAIGLVVIDRAREVSGGGLTWPACRGRLDLYGGTGGIVLFLSALASCDSGGHWRDAALASLTGLTRALRADKPGHPQRSWGCSGTSSLVFALSVAGRLLGDEAALAAARSIARGLPPAAFDDDEALDVADGMAGTLLSFMAAWDVGRDPLLLDLSRRSARRLLDTQCREGSDRGAWLAGRDRCARAGFAHGAAGIAYALARWLPHDPGPATIDAIRAAWDYERRVFRDSGGAWPAILPDGNRLVMAAWCHGAPGIGLARACGRRHADDDQVMSEVSSAMRATLGAPRSTLDHVCCGNLGRAEALFTVGRNLRDPALEAHGRALAESVARQVLEWGPAGMRGRGFERGAPSPGFFQGLAGIGYQLLRTWAPERLASVLAFEAPGGENR